MRGTFTPSLQSYVYTKKKRKKLTTMKTKTLKYIRSCELSPEIPILFPATRCQKDSLVRKLKTVYFLFRFVLFSALPQNEFRVIVIHI